MPIERKPLPPPNSTAMTITEADRAEIIARANDVIDHYLNGPGSYWDAGPRKSLQKTIIDLKNFKDQVIASKQFSDDPNSIMDSIIKWIDQTAEQVEQAARNREGRDSISIPPPNTGDPIDDPRVISPRVLSNAALPVSLPMEGRQPAPPQAEGPPGVSSKLVRILSRRIVDQSPASALNTSAPAAPGHQDSFDHRFGYWASSPEGFTPRNPNLPVPLPEPGRPLGIFSGKPMPLWTVPLPLEGLANNSNASGNDDRNWFTTLAGNSFSPASGSADTRPSPTPEPPKGSAASNLPECIQYAKPRDGRKTQASASQPSAPPASFAPSENPNSMGGLAGRLAALAGIDPENPDQAASQPGGLLGLFLSGSR